jgi:hypothetical protein
MTRKKGIKAWACYGEDGIYVPGGHMAIFPTRAECIEIGADDEEIIQVLITPLPKKKG